MKLLVGLGNPGVRYHTTRHNIGFMAVDRLAEHINSATWRAKFQGHLTEGVVNSEQVLLVKPQTFMNLSGQSVGAVCRFYKIQTQDVIVFHDDLDLAPGKVRIKCGGGHAGHNGLRSLHQHIGADYQRVRIGIGHPGDKNLVSPYVLSRFAKSDESWIDPILDNIATHLDILLAGKADVFSSRIQNVCKD